MGGIQAIVAIRWVHALVGVLKLSNRVAKQLNVYITFKEGSLVHFLYLPRGKKD